MSEIDDHDRHDILLQQIIDDLARRCHGRPYQQVAADLVKTIAAQRLSPKPDPWVNAAAAAAVEGNAYVVSSTTAAVVDMPQLNTEVPGKSIL